MDEALYDERADLWSVGCIIYEAHCGTPPIKTQSFTQLLKWLRNPEIVWPSSISEESKSFLQGLLRKEPKMRLTWPQIVEHPYVKDNLVILDYNKTERPLTEDLTTSQQIRKDKQRDEIIFNRGKKMIADAMSKCQQTKSKIEQKPQELGDHPTKKKQLNVIGDNESISSDDSVNAIIQTDLETDVEGPLIKKGVKIPGHAGETSSQGQNQNLVIKRYTENFSDAAAVGDRENKDNANLKIGTMLENMEKMHLEDENKWCNNKPRKTLSSSPAPPPPPSQPQSHPAEGECSQNVNTNAEQNTSNHQQIMNNDSVKRKLSNNLNNFSIRLGKDLANPDKPCGEIDKDSSKEKVQWLEFSK